MGRITVEHAEHRMGSRQPYERPIIEELGTVAELARGGTGSVSDGGSGQFMVGM